MLCASIVVTIAATVVACLKILAVAVDNGVRREQLKSDATRVQAAQVARLRELRQTHVSSRAARAVADELVDVVEVAEVAEAA